MALADAEGVEALTMRRLAAGLGVEAMTLYYHVPNKAAILDELVERVAAEFQAPPPDADWKAAIRTAALSAHAALERHPWAPGAILTARSLGTHRLRHMDGLLGTLTRAGFSPSIADHAYHAIEGHVMGFSLWVREMRLGTPENLRAMARDFLQSVPRGEFPNVAAHVEHHLAPADPDDPGSFAFALDLLLDSLERLLPPTSARP